MEKRLILFIVLSFLILYFYGLFLPRKMPQKSQEIPKNKVEEKPKVKEMPSLLLISKKNLVFKNPLLKGELSEKGSILSLNLLKFNDRKGFPYTIIKESDTFSIFLDDREIFPTKYLENSFIYELGDFKIIKSYEFSENSYLFNVNLSFVNCGNKTITLPNISISLKSSLGNDPELRENPFIYSLGGKIKKTKSCNVSPVIDWVASQDKYFLFAVVPSMRFSSVSLSKEDALGGFPRYVLKEEEVLVNKIKVYAGPRDYKTLKACSLSLLSGLWFFSKFLLFVLVLIEKIVKNYGLAIILLTLFIKIILHPLTRKNFKMMKKMAAIKPHIDKLKEKHKDDHKTIQEETIKLYKEHNVNPFGGCFPILLQMPVFFALYSVMDKAIELRGAPFILWIKDLSLKDPYFVLPILMGITMLIQQRMTPSSSSDPAMNKMMFIMPIAMTFVFLNFPSGLVLYWLSQNILTIIEHWIIEKGIEK